MLTLYFPINSTSLGSSAWHIFRHIEEDIALFPMGGNADLDSFAPITPELQKKLVDAMERGAKSIDVKGKSLKLWHQFGGIERITAKQGLYTFHELDALTETERHSLNQQEYVIVPCNFNKTTFLNNGVTAPVHVVPLGVDRTVFYPLEKYKTKTGPYIFTMAGKFEARKNHFEILKAFHGLFANNPNVKLRAAITNRFINMDEVFKHINQNVFQGQMPNNIEFIQWLPTERHFADFLGHSDCFISPSRGESFNLPLLQAMSCGVPVITNADHAHADYVTAENSILVKSSGTSVASDGMFFRNDGRTNTGKWFDINVNEIAQAMIKAFQGGRKVNTAGIETAAKFDWKTTANSILKIHNSI